jgi:lysophospholipase L1-like esterase
MAARMQAEMKENPASLVVWQAGTEAAIRQVSIDQFTRWLRNGLALGKSLGADFVLMNLQYVPAVVAAPDKEAYEKAMAAAAKEYDAGLFRRFDIMRGWYQDGMPYAQFVQLDGLHLNDFGQKCIGKLLTRSILNSLNGP